MATMYVKWPGYDGSATAKGYEKWSELASIDYDISRHITQSASRATNRESAHPEMSNIVLGKTADLATPKLFEASVVGQGETVEIHMCFSAGKGVMQPYLILKLENCVVSGYSVNATQQSIPRESIRLAFERIEFEFTIFKKDNVTPDGSKQTMFDLQTFELS